MEEAISLKDLFKIIKERIILIVFISGFAVLIAAVISYYILTPLYETSTHILVNQEQTDVIRIDNQTIQTDLQLINTYDDIIKSPVILDKVIEQSGLKTTFDQLNEQITVENNEESQVFRIKVIDENLTNAVLIANTTAEVFQMEIEELMDVNNVSILTPAVVKSNATQVQPKPLLNIAVAGVAGLLLGIGIAFLLSYLNNTLKNEEDIRDFLDIPVLGIISPIVEKEQPQPLSSVPAALNRREG